MEVLKEEEEEDTAAEVTKDDPSSLPGPEALERPPVVSLEPCARFLRRFPETSFNRFLKSLFLVILGLSVARFIIELNIFQSVFCCDGYQAYRNQSLSVVPMVFLPFVVVIVVYAEKKYALTARIRGGVKEISGVIQHV